MKLASDAHRAAAATLVAAALLVTGCTAEQPTSTPTRSADLSPSVAAPPSPATSPATTAPPTPTAPSTSPGPTVVTIPLRVERRTDDEATFLLVLAEGEEVDRLCEPYDTGGSYSCQNGPVVAVNADRWRTPQEQDLEHRAD